MSSPQFFVASPKRESMSSPEGPPDDKEWGEGELIMFPAVGTLDSC